MGEKHVSPLFYALLGAITKKNTLKKQKIHIMKYPYPYFRNIILFLIFKRSFEKLTINS